MGPQPGNQSEHGRLPAAGRSEDRNELAFPRQVGNREGDIADHGQPAEAFRDAAKIDDGGNGAHGC